MLLSLGNSDVNTGPTDPIILVQDHSSLVRLGDECDGPASQSIRDYFGYNKNLIPFAKQVPLI